MAKKESTPEKGVEEGASPGKPFNVSAQVTSKIAFYSLAILVAEVVFGVVAVNSKFPV